MSNEGGVCMWLWISAIILLLIINIIIVILTRLFFTVTYLHKTDGDYLSIELRFWKWIRIKKEIPLVAIDKEELSIKTKEKTEVGKDNKGSESKSYTPEEFVSQFERFKDLLQRVVGLHSIMKRFLSKVHIEKLLWDTQVGTSEASTTGMACGGVWAIKGCIVGLLASLTQLDVKPEMYVTPYFQQKHTQTRLECMFYFRFGQAIFAVFLLVRHTHGRVPKWRKKTA